MEKRLKIAKKLLKEEGVIFISIDDNEQAQLKILCDEIFWINHISTIIWQKKYAASNDNKGISSVHEYILCYAKNSKIWSPFLLARPKELDEKYNNPDNDSRWVWNSTNLSVKTFSQTNHYEIIWPTGLVFLPPPSRCWVVSKEKYKSLLDDNRIWFWGQWTSRPYIKTFLSEVQQWIVPTSLWLHWDAGHNIWAKTEIRNIFQWETKLFDTPKPTKLLNRILKISAKKDSIILDFFAGSGTTWHAVLELNKEDWGQRQFILCTNNENKIAEEVTYPRIRNVIDGYSDVEGIPANLRYYKTEFIGVEKSLDDLRYKFIGLCDELLCIKENTFEEVKLKQSSDALKLFTNSGKSLVILYDIHHFDACVKLLRTLENPTKVYIFSLSKEIYEEALSGIWKDIEIANIPDDILQTYKKIFHF